MGSFVLHMFASLSLAVRALEISVNVFLVNYFGQSGLRIVNIIRNEYEERIKII